MFSDKKSEPLIYCGPSLARGKLSQYAVYKNGLPKHLEKDLEECPAIARLFVSPGDLAKTMEAVNKKGAAENVWYKQVLEYARGGNE